MRYIDTGSRDPQQALGSWLNQELANPAAVEALRWQSGFFAAGVLGVFEATFGSLEERGKPARVLVGSNDGMTKRQDVEALLTVLGAPRTGREVGVVSFETGYFHPKTVHIQRADGSATAYVGSGNLTVSGVGGLHVEAGTLLDSRDGDDEATLQAVADAVDRWFEARPAGLHYVTDTSDLDQLVKDGLLDVPAPPRQPRTQAGGGPATKPAGHRLQPLTALPPAKALATSVTAQVVPTGSSAAQPTSAVVPAAVTSAGAAVTWSKPLTRSDAQRKATGHQRGAITLVSSRSGVNTATWFRFDLLGGISWATGQTRTGEVRETAVVPMDVRVTGRSLGLQNMLVTYAPNREEEQNNYTTLLHVGPLGPDFAKTDMTRKTLTIERSAAGSYTLTIV